MTTASAPAPQAPRTTTRHDSAAASAPATPPRSDATATAITRLNALGAELARHGWRTCLTTHPGAQPTLLIHSPAPGATAIAEAIYAIQLGERWMYWWSRSCGPDPASAARTITTVMRSPGHRATSPPRDTSELRGPARPADPDDLALIAAGFPAFRIWREARFDGARYTAQARTLATRPAAVVTGDLAELCTALTSSPQACGQ